MHVNILLVLGLVAFIHTALAAPVPMTTLSGRFKIAPPKLLAHSVASPLVHSREDGFAFKGQAFSLTPATIGTLRFGSGGEVANVASDPHSGSPSPSNTKDTLPQ